VAHADVLTAPDQLQFASLGGIGNDSLVGALLPDASSGSGGNAGGSGDPSGGVLPTVDLGGHPLIGADANDQTDAHANDTGALHSVLTGHATAML
jgi:hypothetical protein